MVVPKLTKSESVKVAVSDELIFYDIKKINKTDIKVSYKPLGFNEWGGVLFGVQEQLSFNL